MNVESPPADPPGLAARVRRLGRRRHARILRADYNRVSFRSPRTWDLRDVASPYSAALGQRVDAKGGLLPGAILYAGLTSIAHAADDPAAIAATIAQPLPPVRVDEGRVRAAGIRKLSSKRLTLYTDLPPEASVEELPGIFDQAFPQWCGVLRR